DGKTVSFGRANQSTPAILMQTVVAPEDGFAALSAGGDYWWCVLANGEVVFDLLAAGNWRTPYTPSCYGVPVPLHKGTNVVAVLLYGGAASWRWGWKNGNDLPTNRLCRDKARSLEMIREGMFGKVEKARTPGRNRLDAATRDYLTRVLGIRSDIDLRRDDECYGMKGSPLGDGATWFHYSSASYGKMQDDWGREAFTKVFKVFLDEKNYPIDFHCIAGQDRTGAVAFILGALLGMDEEDLYLDWETTGFWNGSANFCHARLFNHLVAGFDKWPGKTVNERVEAYVLSLGFTKDDIAKLRGLMLE
ncbi:MAG: tyrosine-protein phosphatase, partial [Kiritimatiellae bacterium]|nr:tyrosine-protein phosphatase [Kiritimatiellia bacterium]